MTIVDEAASAWYSILLLHMQFYQSIKSEFWRG